MNINFLVKICALWVLSPFFRLFLSGLLENHNHLVTELWDVRPSGSLVKICALWVMSTFFRLFLSGLLENHNHLVTELWDVRPSGSFGYLPRHWRRFLGLHACEWTRYDSGTTGRLVHRGSGTASDVPVRVASTNRFRCFSCSRIGSLRLSPG